MSLALLSRYAKCLQARFLNKRGFRNITQLRRLFKLTVGSSRILLPLVISDAKARETGAVCAYISHWLDSSLDQLSTATLDHLWTFVDPEDKNANPPPFEQSLKRIQGSLSALFEITVSFPSPDVLRPLFEVGHSGNCLCGIIDASIRLTTIPIAPFTRISSRRLSY